MVGQSAERGGWGDLIENAFAALVDRHAGGTCDARRTDATGSGRLHSMLFREGGRKGGEKSATMIVEHGRETGHKLCTEAIGDAKP